MKWGEIPQDQLTMKTYTPDTNASAVILCDYGEITVDTEGDFVTKRHRRVKILSTRGYSWGEFSVVVSSNKKYGSLKDVQAATYVIDSTGAKVVIATPVEDFHTEKLQETLHRKTLTLRGLAPGCVIEYQYTLVSPIGPFDRPWLFQETEPVLWSEFRTIIPKDVLYDVVGKNFVPWAMSEQIDIRQPLAADTTGDSVLCTFSRWAVRNAPAVREEPFITRREDFTTKVTLQLNAFRIFIFSFSMANTWDAIASRFLQAPLMKTWYKDMGEAEDVVEEVAPKTESERERFRRLFLWVKKNLNVEEGVPLFPSKVPDDVFDDRRGTPGDVNFAFLQLARSAGLKADPVLVSSRSHGAIIDDYPTASQFDQVVIRTVYDSTETFVDFSDRLISSNLVNPRVLNTKGLLVQNGPATWVPVISKRKADQFSLALVEIDKEGTLHGTADMSHVDYGAHALRRLLDQKDILNEAAIRAVIPVDRLGFTLDSISIKGRDSVETPLVVHASITGERFASVIDSNMYFNPHVFYFLSDQPFMRSDRRLPLDFGVPPSLRASISFAIPPEYEVAELPRDIDFSNPSGTVRFVRRTGSDGQKVQVVYSMRVEKPTFKTGEYSALRSVFIEAARAVKDQVVLKLKNSHK